MAELRIGIDVGGTFTDLVALADGRLLGRKVPSTPADFSTAVLNGLSLLLEDVGALGTDVSEVIHGTTVATNAIIQKQGATTGLITTKGFRDILEIGRLRTPRLYDLTWRKPPPLVPRRLRIEADERVMTDGTVDRPLDEESVRTAARILVERGVQSIAICFINAFANPSHERRAADLVRSVAPEVAVSVSHQILPEMREYERTSTTVIDAYIRPVVDGYLSALEDGLRHQGVETPLLIMQSSGGLMSSAVARDRPVFIVESGPAAGVMGSMHLGNRLGHANVLSFNMGGTTAKAATVRAGDVSYHSEYEVGGDLHMGHHLLQGGGYMLRFPSIELAEVGAGGGSIVWVDEAGGLQVGPQSAGAVPGPACYGLGGTEPTVTDANLVLGYLNPDFLVGGDLRLDPDAARRAIAKAVDQSLNIDATEAAYGAYLVANSRMIRAMRAVTSEKGQDPADFVMYAFGGGGPAHAATIARELGVKRIVVPPSPGLFSSLGLLFTDVEHHYVQTLVRDVPNELSPHEVNRTIERMEVEAIAELEREGFPADRVEISVVADMRYRGQRFELSVDLPASRLNSEQVTDLAERFNQVHESAFGYRSDEQVQLINLRLIARGVPDRPRMPESIKPASFTPQDSQRRAYFGPEHGWIDTPVIARNDLSAERMPGPVIIEEYDATTVIPPDARVSSDEWGDIVIETIA